MKFEYKEPDFTMSYSNWIREGFPNWTGMVKLVYNSGKVSYRWLKNGVLNKELGPACVSPDGILYYYIDGVYCIPELYWKHMFEKYKGTEHEALCLIELLCKNEI